MTTTILNNNNNNNEEEEEFKYSNKYNIKELFLKRIKLNALTTKIETINDISNIQIAFCKHVPFDNTDILNNGYNLLNEQSPIKMENIIKRILIDNLGGYCTQLNLLFGTFLYEMGIINIKLIKGIQNSNLFKSNWFQFHIGNIIKFNDNKLYLVDVGFGCLSPFKPIELGNLNSINYYSPIPNKLYRVRKIEDNELSSSYLYEESSLSNDHQLNTFTPIFHFNLNSVSFKNLELNSISYSKCGIDKLILIKLFENGNYHLFKDKLITEYNNDSNKEIEIFNIIDINHFKEITKLIFYNNNNNNNNN